MMELIREEMKEKRLEMIRRALQEKAPLTYADLESTGGLKSFLETREAEMMKYFGEAQKRAWEETLSVFLDFFDPSYDETTSPM
ncbi:MAG TPA: hypothetical protein P5040_07110 [Smithella sp.]|nr:hypothetical protein [Smithella sp.]HRS97939.1 hypothetical protein [Smithella sp.]